MISEQQFARNPLFSDEGLRLRDELVGLYRDKVIDQPSHLARREEIPVESIVSSQEFVRPQTLETMEDLDDDWWDDNPVTVQELAGRRVLSDGNHRVNTARTLGRKTIPAIVRPWAEVPPGFAPQPRVRPATDGL